MDRWQTRLEDLAREHAVPGASLAILEGDRLHTAVTGVVNVETGVAVTPDTLFAIGSTTKMLTSTAVMRLVDDGRLDLDAPVSDVMRDFRMAESGATARVTARRLLTHTSGIAGDALLDTGGGDDALQRFLARVGELPADVPVGTVHSYSNAGFVVLGRLIEVLTGLSWDAAVRELVLDPLGMSHTTSVATDLVRFRATCGHVSGPDGPALEPRAPIGHSLRSMSPAGSTMYASAADVVTLGAMFIARGLAADGSRVLSEAAVEEMLRSQVAVPAAHPGTESSGLGWMMYAWGGPRVLEHGGGTIGHLSFFEVVPDRAVAVAVLTNGRHDIGTPLVREVLRELCDVVRPAPPEPQGPLPADAAALCGSYARCGVRVDVELRDGALVATETIVEPLASMFPGMEPVALELAPTGIAGTYVCRESAEDEWEPVIFTELEGERFLHKGGRGHRRA